MSFNHFQSNGLLPMFNWNDDTYTQLTTYSVLIELSPNNRHVWFSSSFLFVIIINCDVTQDKYVFDESLTLIKRNCDCLRPIDACIVFVSITRSGQIYPSRFRPFASHFLSICCSCSLYLSSQIHNPIMKLVIHTFSCFSCSMFIVCCHYIHTGPSETRSWAECHNAKWVIYCCWLWLWLWL